MRFTSFSLLFLTASFVSAKEDGLQQQQQQQQQLRNHQTLSGVHSDVRKEGKRNTRGGLISGGNKSNNNNYNVDKDATVDVGILSLNSHNYVSGNTEDNHNLDRDLQTCSNCCVGITSFMYFPACDNAQAAIGDYSCNGYRACGNAGKDGSATIGENACNGVKACFGLGSNEMYSVIVGNGSCVGDLSCQFQGIYGDVTIGDNSCTSTGFDACSIYVGYYYSLPADTIGNPTIIGNNACTCARCCYNIHPGSIVGDNQCTSVEEGCARTLVLPATPAPTTMETQTSEIPSSAPSKIPSSAPSQMPSSAPSQMPSSAPSQMPSSAPSQIPSSAPSKIPSTAPSQMPSSAPSEMPSAADCGDFVCDSNPKLVAMCITSAGTNGASTQCFPKTAVNVFLGKNEGNKCGPCDG